MAESFVKALYDYHSNESDDLSFKAGTIIRVTAFIDDNWTRGECNGKTGLFPSSFVEPIIPDNVEKTVIAKETYISGEDGVLTFFRGDVLTFLGFVDDYWCKGGFAGEVGLFPAFTVDGLNELSSPMASNTSPKARPASLTLEPSPVSFQEPCAETLFEFKGLSVFELSFPPGEIILLTKDVDEEWFEGSFNGKIGIFPKGFVKVLTPLGDQHYEAVVESSVPYAIAVYPFVGETTAELSFREGDVIYLHSWVSPEWIEGEMNDITGIFPSSFVQIQVELPQEFQEPSSSEAEWVMRNGFDDVVTKQTNGSSFSVGDNAVAIYSFTTNTDGDLSFEVGDLITIERIIDDEWVEGRKDGTDVGLCPAVFLQLQESALKPDSEVKESGIVSASETPEPVQDIPSLSTDTKHPYAPEPLEHSGKEGSMSDLGKQNSYSQKQNLSLNIKPISNVSTLEVPDYINSTNLSDTSSKTISEKPSTTSNHKDLTQKTKSSKPLLSPKPALAPKPPISPKPDFLKKPGKPVSPEKPVSPNKTTGLWVGNSIESQNAVPIKKQRQTSDVAPQSVASNWVKFEDQEKSFSTDNVKPTVSIYGSNSSVSSTNMTLEESYNISYKSLLDKSLDDDLSSKSHPVPPPRLDLLSKKGSRSNTSNALSDKLAQQAKEFENSHHSGKKSPSLNELRAASQKSKNVRPAVPARKNKLPALRPSDPSDADSGEDKSENGFPILHELEVKIIKLNNELQKETKVLSGAEVLIQMVNKDTSRKEELESKKGITDRKIQDLKRQLKKTEDQKKHLKKLVAGCSSQLDVKLRIEQLQESIKENIETRDNLQSILSENEDDETAKDLRENILFCDEAIKNLKTQLNPLMDILLQLEGGVLKETHLEKEKDVNLRKKVIDEILNTENSFVSDLNLCISHFMMQLIEWKVDAIDCDILFGNMPEVASLSSKLLHKLKTATDNVDINNQIIGTCFVDFSEEITAVYGRYCRNHDDAIAFMEKSANDEDVQQYFSKCLESIREFSNCWDLSSFLIKPVQRILKYPLLLNELLKHTPDDHPDKTGLIKAIHVMTTAANDVNEFKRRKDLVQKYQKVEESGLSTKFQKFTWHSVVKKSTRFNQRITQFTGLVSQTVDENFKEKEKMFHQIEKTMKNFVKNITQYIEQFVEVYAYQVQTAENIVDYYQENANMKEIQDYHEAQKYIGENLVNELKDVLDAEVISPLNNLLQLFQGPQRLIQKRHDKCLDYDSLSNKIEKIKDRDKWKQAKEELEFAKKNYEALNAQLLDELPVFNSKALVFLNACITNFAKVHKIFFVKALDQFSSSVQLSVVNSEGADIVSDFLSQSQLGSHEIFQLTFTPKKLSLLASKPVRPSASPKTGRASLAVEERISKSKCLKRSVSESKRKAPLSPQDSGIVTRSQTVSVRDRSLFKNELGTRANSSSNVRDQKNDSENAFHVVKFAFSAEATAELSVNKEDVVKVLEYNDSFGNSEWWKVEHAGQIGYVPSSFLAPLSMSVDSKTDTENGSPLVDSATEYTVRYNFEAHSATELSVTVGDVVKVLQKHDPSGYHEWWSVEVNGKQGYVPASYLVKR